MKRKEQSVITYRPNFKDASVEATRNSPQADLSNSINLLDQLNFEPSPHMNMNNMIRKESKLSIKLPFKNFDLDNRSRSIRHGGVSLLSHKDEVPQIISPSYMIKMGAPKV